MKRYSVHVPFAGSICVEVSAENSDDAIALAIDKAANAANFTVDSNEADLGEWEVMRYLVRGNVNYMPLAEAEAEAEAEELENEDE